ncbi:unnamed protein product [Prorocentrum cordatum]|uniref:Uncharacterized protein n=1 Tax=Prorocentrum cordatum TaxID=2364126 RepID=A0ABN9WQB6_9DINO|nr:unnamed protein product [Polarella glacialis]
MCAQVDRSRCIHLPTQTILQRYTIPLVALQLGVDIFVLDFDIYPFQDPTPHVVGELLSYGSRVPDVLVAGSFGDACILNAWWRMVFYRSTRRARDFLRGLLRWLYEAGRCRREALSAFLGEDPLQKSQGAGGGPPGPPRYGEPGAPWVVRAEALQRGLGQDPREGALPTVDWALLSPENAFVSARVGATSGWAGAVGGIVLFHFFHGGWVESGSVFEQARAHDDDFEVFFGGAADGGEEGASRRSRIVERVLSSRVGDARPPTALSCSTVPVDVFSSGRPGAA